MKNDIFNTFEEKDLFLREPLYDENTNTISWAVETYFDPNKKFGLNLETGSGAWINMYIVYNVNTQAIVIQYYICTDNLNQECIYTPINQEEKKLFQDLVQKNYEVFKKEENIIKRKVKFSVKCRAYYTGELIVSSDEPKEVLKEIRERLDEVAVDELTWLEDLLPDEAVTLDDIQSIEEIEED